MPTAPAPPTAEQFLDRLRELATPERRAQIQRALKAGRGTSGARDVLLGVRMGSVFTLAKEFIGLPLAEIGVLLDSPVHEARVGAVSVMGKQALRRAASAEERTALFELYLRRTDAINTWDLVDVSAHQVIGAYLHDFDHPRTVLYELARSESWWERRIAIFSTLYLVRKGEVDDTFALAEILAHDEHDLVQKAVGGLLREAGKQDADRLYAFLDQYAATAPRALVRQAVERLDKDRRARYLDLNRQAG